MTEIELKLLLDEAGEKALRASPALKRLAEGAPRRRVLRSIYYDAPDRRLQQAGIALRLRKVGRGWVQTVKRGKPKGETGSGLFTPQELETPAPGGRLDLALIHDDALRAAVEQAVGDAPLSPAFETVMTRTARDLVTGLGRAELAIDVGEVVAGDARAPFREVELELKSGAPAVLYDLARELFADIPARFSERSKSARGYALAAGGSVSPPSDARNARTPALSSRDTTEAAATAILRECLAQIDANATACLVSDAPKGPHQLRVGLRRLRSAFALFAPALDSDAMRDLNARARDLAQVAGELRDLDVLVGEILSPARDAAPRDEAGIAALEAEIATRRRLAREGLRSALSGPQARLFIIDLSAFVELRGWLRPADHDQTAELARPVVETAAQALEQRRRKARKRAKGLETLSHEQRHDLRKQLKKLRYGVDFFAPLFPEDAVMPYLKALKKLQNVFGSLNDIAMAEARLEGEGAPAAAHPDAQRAVGRLLGRLELKAEDDWGRAGALWQALEAQKPFWR